jgi:hypothetical protein
MAGVGGRGRSIAAAAAAVLVVGAASCGGGGDDADTASVAPAPSEVNGKVTIELDGTRIEGDASECTVSESAIDVRAMGTLEGETVVITVERIAVGDELILISRVTGTDTGTNGSRRYDISNATEIEISGSTLRTTAEWVRSSDGQGDAASGVGTLEATCS